MQFYAHDSIHIMSSTRQSGLRRSIFAGRSLSLIRNMTSQDSDTPCWQQDANPIVLAVGKKWRVNKFRFTRYMNKLTERCDVEAYQLMRDM